jgi:hypothetical protein
LLPVAADEQHVRHFVVVPDGLLAIDAIAAVLHQCLLVQLAQRYFAPGLRLRPERPRGRGDEQSGQLAEQVIVRGRMPREVAGDEVAVLKDRSRPALAQGFALIPEQVPCERPVDQAHRVLEAAAPMRAARVRTLLEP